MPSCFTPTCKFSNPNKVHIYQTRQHMKAVSKTWIFPLITKATSEGEEDYKKTAVAKTPEEEEQQLTIQLLS